MPGKTSVFNPTAKTVDLISTFATPTFSASLQIIATEITEFLKSYFGTNVSVKYNLIHETCQLMVMTTLHDKEVHSAGLDFNIRAIETMDPLLDHEKSASKNMFIIFFQVICMYIHEIVVALLAGAPPDKNVVSEMNKVIHDMTLIIFILIDDRKDWSSSFKLLNTEEPLPEPSSKLMANKELIKQANKVNLNAQT